MKNPLKTWVFMIALSMGLLLLGHTLGERQGTLLAFIAALSLFFVVFFYGDLRILDLYQGEEVEGQDPWGLLDLISKISSKISIPIPRLFVTPIATPLIFAAGRNWKNGLIIISEGAIDRLSPEEIEALITICMFQIRKMDTLSFGVGGTLAALIMNPATWADKVISYSFYRTTDRIDFFRKITAPLASLIVRLSVSKRGYFDADQAAAKTLHQGETVAMALWKLQGFATTLPVDIPATTAHFFIVNPLTSKAWNRYFHIQPPIALRIQRLIGRYPI